MGTARAWAPKLVVIRTGSGFAASEAAEDESEGDEDADPIAESQAARPVAVSNAAATAVRRRAGRVDTDRDARMRMRRTPWGRA